jgi:hypothetical protein
VSNRLGADSHEEPITLTPIAQNANVLYRPDPTSAPGCVVGHVGSRYRVAWFDSPPAWHDREELVGPDDHDWIEPPAT